uniref:Calcineurin-like phosphoesterase n=1 Tax=Pithovirus LCPAC403 TaxID=2506596 RepID=A0A481ZD74_9VIRU|nr:MAG: calcineurin-like phosphoesterase [Pithovirus LCPAC403]
MRIKLVSDLHLESNDLKRSYVKALPYHEPKQTTVCVLAGDIGELPTPSYVDFLMDARSKYNYVLLVAGNHEMRGYDIAEMHRCLNKLCEDTGCVYLNRSSIIIEGIEFVGATLWVHISDNMNSEANDHFKEFKNVTVNNRIFTVSELNKINREDVEYITSRVENTLNVIVITHYPPSQFMCGIHNMKTQFYCNDLDVLASKALAWFSGHTHLSCVHLNMYSNAKGYPKQLTLFDEDFELMV